MADRRPRGLLGGLRELAVRAHQRIWRAFFARTGLDLRGVGWRLAGLGAHHAEPSAIASAQDAPGAPSRRLLELAPRLIPRCRRARLPLLRERQSPAEALTWPGEHYCLLEALVRELAPRRILEIGTHTGLSALAMLPALDPEAILTTVDLLPWRQIPGTLLRAEDFRDGRCRQILADLAEPAAAREHAELLRSADLIFCDGPKDGRFEPAFLANLLALGPAPGCLLVFDDIRVWNMLDCWRRIELPKLDFTSFGHWSGTGLVDAGPPGREGR